MVLFPNGDITIYNLNKKTQEYSRLNFDNVNVNSKRNAGMNDKGGANGVNIFYTTTVIAPRGNYKIDVNDKVVKGHIELDITKITDLKDYEVMTVVGTQESDFFDTICIECK